MSTDFALFSFVANVNNKLVLCMDLLQTPSQSDANTVS